MWFKSAVNSLGLIDPQYIVLSLTDYELKKLNTCCANDFTSVG